MLAIRNVRRPRRNAQQQQQQQQQQHKERRHRERHYENDEEEEDDQEEVVVDRAPHKKPHRSSSSPSPSSSSSSSSFAVYPIRGFFQEMRRQRFGLMGTVSEEEGEEEDDDAEDNKGNVERNANRNDDDDDEAYESTGSLDVSLRTESTAGTTASESGSYHYSSDDEATETEGNDDLTMTAGGGVGGAVQDEDDEPTATEGSLTEADDGDQQHSCCSCSDDECECRSPKSSRQGQQPQQQEQERDESCTEEGSEEAEEQDNADNGDEEDGDLSLPYASPTENSFNADDTDDSLSASDGDDEDGDALQEMRVGHVRCSPPSRPYNRKQYNDGQQPQRQQVPSVNQEGEDAEDTKLPARPTTLLPERQAHTRYTPPAVQQHRHHQHGAGAGFPSLESASLEYLESQIEPMRETYGPKHPHVARLWNHIGNAHFRARRYEDALDAYKESVNCELGSHLADSYSNLGTVYWATGQIQKAIDFLHRAKKVHKYYCLVDDKDPDRSLEIATVRYQIGLAYTLEGSYKKALKHLLECRETRVRELGHDHMEVARVADALGRVYVLRHEVSTAIRWYSESLRIKQLFADQNDDPSLTLSTLNNLAGAHRMRGDTEAAISTYCTILDIHEELLNRAGTEWRTHRRAVAETLSLIGELLTQQGDFRNARDTYNKAMHFAVGAGFQKVDIERLQSKLDEL